jgi:hypothetical protein
MPSNHKFIATAKIQMPPIALSQFSPNIIGSESSTTHLFSKMAIEKIQHNNMSYPPVQWYCSQQLSSGDTIAVSL